MGGDHRAEYKNKVASSANRGSGFISMLVHRPNHVPELQAYFQVRVFFYSCRSNLIRGSCPLPGCDLRYCSQRYFFCFFIGTCIECNVEYMYRPLPDV
jgi:hypothetical protein